MVTGPFTMDFKFILWESFKMERIQQWAGGGNTVSFPRKVRVWSCRQLKHAELVGYWVFSTFIRDAQDFAESKLWAIRLSKNINEMLSLYQMELSDKYSGCQAQKIVNLSHIPWQQRGILLKTDLCNRNCTCGGVSHSGGQKADLLWSYLPLFFVLFFWGVFLGFFVGYI